MFRSYNSIIIIHIYIQVYLSSRLFCTVLNMTLTIMLVRFCCRKIGAHSGLDYQDLFWIFLERLHPPLWNIDSDMTVRNRVLLDPGSPREVALKHRCETRLCRTIYTTIIIQYCVLQYSRAGTCTYDCHTLTINYLPKLCDEDISHIHSFIRHVFSSKTSGLEYHLSKCSEAIIL